MLAVPHEPRGALTVNTTLDSSKSAKWSDTKKDKSGVLALGDILSLMVKDFSEEKAEVKVVTGDGIANVEMECAPKSFFDTNGEQARFRQCLFKVETASQYGFQTRNKMFKDYASSAPSEPQLLKAIDSMARDEAAANSTEAWEVLGKAVAYGDRIQLRHLQSDSYVTISEEIAREPGCLKVVLDKDGNEGSWLLVEPCNRLQREGEVVRYSDPFFLRVSLDKSDYYLHLAKKVGRGVENIRELNGSITPSQWQARKFISHAELKKNPEFVSTGDSFRIILKQSDGYLTVTSPSVASILPPRIVESKKQDAKEQKSEPKLYVDYDKTSLNVWELERRRVSVGGIALEHEIFRLKNVSTGLFLAVEFEKNVVMTKDGNKDTVLFKFIPEDATGGPLKFKTLLRFQHYRSGRFIQGKSENIELHGLFGEVAERNPIIFTLATDSSHPLSQIFMFEDEAEDNTVHIHQVSLVMPKIVSYYSFLQEWGLLQRKGDYVPDFEYAKSTESDLETNSKHLTQILANVTRRVLKDEEAGLKLRQQSILESNLLLVLLKLAELIHDKSKFSGVPLKKGETEESTPQTLARGHLKPLARQLYMTLLSAIKNNPECCQVLYSHAAFLSTQLSDYKVEVGKLLKETFRHTVAVEHSVRQEELSTWLQQIQPLDEVNDNILGQTVILKIMCSLCLASNQALPKFQNIIDDGLAGRSGKLCKFRMYSGEPCFELDTGGHLDKFLEANPVLKILGKKVEDDHVLVAVFFLNTVTPHKNLVNYLVAMLNVLIHISYDRNSKAATQVIKDYNLSFDFAFTCMKDQRITLKLRERFSSLCRVIFLDRDPLMQLSDREHTCFIWDQIEAKISDREDYGGNIDLFPFLRQSEAVVVRVTELVQWVEQVWVSPDYPYKQDYLGDKVHFITEILRLTKLLIDLGYTGYEFFSNVHKSILSLIRNDPEDELHWCVHLSQEIIQNSESVSDAVTEMLETAVEVLALGVRLREARQTEAFCNCFGRMKDCSDPEEQSEMLMEKVFKDNEFETRVKEQKDDTEKVKRQKSNKKIVPEEVPEPQAVDFDQVLLSLFFQSYSSRLTASIFPVILSNFYQRQVLKSLLATSNIIENSESLMVFRKLKAIHGRFFVLIREIKFASDVSKHNLEKTASNEMNELLITLRLIAIEIKKLLNLSQPTADVKLAQSICKSLGITMLLFAFLEEDYPWLVRNAEGTIVLPTWTVEIYKEVMSCLYLNCFCNTEVQQFGFEKITAVLRLTANDIGCSKLMRELMASQRTAAMISNSVDYTIGWLSSHPEPRNRPGDLAIFIRLIVDDDGRLHKRNQEMIFKAVTQSQNLMRMYEEDGSVNLTVFKQDTDIFIRFHSNLIRLLGLCALDNRIVTMHCQRLLPFYFLFREICKENVHYYVKREYLMFIFRVYAVELTDGMKRGLPLNDFYELLNSVILPDLELFVKHRDNLLAIGRKNMFPSIYCGQATEFAFNSSRAILENRRKSLASMLIPKNSQQAHIEEEFDLTSLTKDQHDSLMYWKYITNYKSWSPHLCSGMLEFIEAFSQELNIHNHPCSPELYASLDRMKQMLGELLDSVMELRKDHTDLDFSAFVSQLNDCIQEIPNYILDEAAQETEAQEQKAYQELLSQIKAYLERTHLSLSEFFAHLHEEQMINKKQLLLKLKDILEKQISSHQLILALNYMDPQLQQQYDLKAFHSDMKRFLHRSSYVVRKLKNVKDDVEEEKKEEVVPSHINSELQLFLKTRYEQISHSSAESTEMAAALIEAISRCQEVNGAGAFLLVLRQSDDTTPQLQLLKALVEVARTQREDERGMKQVREWLCAAETIEIVLDLSYTCSNSELAEQCIAYVNSLLTVEMDSVLHRVTKKLIEISFPFFTFFVEELRTVKGWILQQTKEKAIMAGLTFTPAYEFASADQAFGQQSFSVAIQLLHLVQLCCKTCDRTYQSLFRVQQSSLGSVNVVSEIANFLIFLRGVPDIKERTSESDAWTICHEVLDALLDLMSGVCVENQKEIGAKRALYRFVNWMIEEHYSYTDEDDKRLSITVKTIRLLRVLIEGAKDAYLADIIIEEVNVSDLVRVTEAIYAQLVESRVKKVLQDSAGHSKVGWECLELSGDEVTQMQREIIEMAFDIRILLKKLNLLSSTQVRVEKKEEMADEEELSAAKLKKFEEKFYTNFKTSQFRDQMPTNLLVLSPFQKVQAHMSRPKEQEKAQQLFFEAFVSAIDINYKGEIVRLYFRIPAVCSHAPRFMRRHLVKKMAMLGHQEKLRNFVDLAETYELEMKHRQELARYPVFITLFKRWRTYYRLSFYLIVIINVMILSTREHDSGNTGSSSLPNGIEYAQLVLGVLQVVLVALAFISYNALHYPVIVNRRLQYDESRLKKKLVDPMSRSGHRLSVELSIRASQKSPHAKVSILYQITSMLIDPSVIYNFVYLTLSALALGFWPIYPILLLDFVKRINTLARLLCALWNKAIVIVMLTLLCLIAVYGFSIIAFLDLQEYYETEKPFHGGIAYCDTLWTCFLSTVLLGLRSEGGIGEATRQAVSSDSLYINKLIFNFSFYLLISLLFFCLLFGVFIDSLAKSREKEAEKIANSRRCFICGSAMEVLEANRINWQNHVFSDHNVHSYLFFLVYIRNKPMSQCRGVERFVKEELETGRIDFFPLPSQVIETK